MRVDKEFPVGHTFEASIVILTFIRFDIFWLLSNGYRRSFDNPQIIRKSTRRESHTRRTNESKVPNILQE